MSNKITDLKVQKREKERVNVFVDGAFAFAVPLDVASRLRQGQQLTAAEMAELRRMGEEDLVYRTALRYLGRRPRSEVEVTRYLEGKGHDGVLVAAILDRLRRRNYVDDAAFAAYWVEQRARFRPRGRTALRYELRQRGVDTDSIETAIADQNEDAAAWAAVAPKLDRWLILDRKEFEQKVLGHLARRGFAFAVARQVAERAWRMRDDD